MTFVNYYEVLEVDPAADTETIKLAIRKQRREWRNRSAHPKAETRALAERMTQHISDAESVLLDSTRRGDYDRQFSAQVESAQYDTAGSGGRDWVSIIREYLSNGNPSAANFAARDATNEQPNLAEAWCLRGTSSALLQNLADAEYELGEAIRLDPNNAAYHAEMADLYASAQNWSRAQEGYQRAGDLEPNNQYYRVGAASMYSAQGKPELALPILERAVKENPGTEFFRYHLAIALADEVTEKWSRFADGSIAILNSAQLDVTRKALARIEGLKVNDPDLNQHLGELARMAADAERIDWAHSNNLAAYGSGMIAALIALFMIGAAPLVGIVGLAALVAIPFMYVKRHKVPGYVRDARQATEFVRKTGLQPAAGQA